MKVLFLAPLPPPITGHSLASKALLDGIAARNEIAVVDLAAGSKHDGSVTFRRFLEVIKVLGGVLRKQKDADVVYLTISESLAGNAKDVAIYLMCARKLRHLIIHLHGGSIKRLLFDRRPWVERINRFFIKRMAGVIISGTSHAPIFNHLIEPGRLHIVPNFAGEEMFVDESVVREKFCKTSPLRVLFISGMDRAKGSPDLVEAYRLLSPELQMRVRIDIAGRFSSPQECAAFNASLTGLSGVRYHGLVDDLKKRELFSRAHVFCLPTAMFEGQPISILEAYASGCAVLTTGQPGIQDVFAHGVNGCQIEIHDPSSIARALEWITINITEAETMALKNLNEANGRYRVDGFIETLSRIFQAAN